MKDSNLMLAAMATSLYCAGAFGATGDGEVRGRQLYESHCLACHSLDANRVGPAHRGVFGRKAGAVAGYDYSDALRRSRIVWSEKSLDLWLTNPERLISGQKMGYSVSDAGDRRDLIAYLRSLSEQR